MMARKSTITRTEPLFAADLPKKKLISPQELRRRKIQSERDRAIFDGEPDEVFARFSTSGVEQPRSSVAGGPAKDTTLTAKGASLVAHKEKRMLPKFVSRQYFRFGWSLNLGETFTWRDGNSVNYLFCASTTPALVEHLDRRREDSLELRGLTVRCSYGNALTTSLRVYVLHKDVLTSRLHEFDEHLKVRIANQMDEGLLGARYDGKCLEFHKVDWMGGSSSNNCWLQHLEENNLPVGREPIDDEVLLITYLRGIFKLEAPLADSVHHGDMNEVRLEQLPILKDSVFFIKLSEPGEEYLIQEGLRRCKPMLSFMALYGDVSSEE